MDSPGNDDTFWSLSPDSGKLNPEILAVYDFLAKRGFRKRTLEDQIELYRQNSHFVGRTYTPEQISVVSHYLEEEFKGDVSLLIDYPRKGPIRYSYDNRDILEKFVKYGWGKIFSDNNSNHLPELNVEIKKHTRDKAFFYFKNGYVEVTRDNIRLLPYSDFNGKYVYKDHLVNREIKIVNVHDPALRDFATKGACFLDFIYRMAGSSYTRDINQNIDLAKAEENPERRTKLNYLMKLMGCLMHDYKQQGLTDFCVVLCDDNTGGSGKGVLIQAFRQMLNPSVMTAVCSIDCRKDVGIFDPENLTERTRIKVYNDVSRDFNFGSVYNEITDGGTIRPMHKPPRAVLYEDTWKVLLTSNYIIRGNNGPDQRRQRVFSMNPFFDKDNTIQKYYGHSFYSHDWKENDWDYFYNVMFHCVQMWLSCDYNVGYIDKEFEQRRIEEEFPFEIRKFVDGIQRGRFHATSDLYTAIKESHEYKNTPFVRKLTANFFGRMLSGYLESQGIKFKRNTNRTEIYIENLPGGANQK
jgi:hypothetical protein